MRKERGITLIALVLTIIVLLILAGVALQAIMGENGIATKAKSAKLESEIAKEKEQIDLSYAECQTILATNNQFDYDGSVVGTTNNEIGVADLLENIMNNSYGDGTVEVSGSISNLTVKYLNSGREYLIERDGVVQAVIDYDELFKSAQKHPDQEESNDIGIAEDGSIVNLDLWEYIDCDLGSYGGTGYALCTRASLAYPGYKDENIIGGKIQGQVPMYIKEEKGSNYRGTNNIYSWCFL